MEIAKRIGRNIVEARERHKLTQQTLAYRTGLSMSTVAKLETGRHWPHIGTLEKVAKALETSVEELMGIAASLRPVAA